MNMRLSSCCLPHGRLVARFLLILTAVLLLWALPSSATPTQFLQDGNGFWWDFTASGAVEDGRGPSQAPDSVDAFDTAAQLNVEGTVFPETAPQSVEGGGRMIVTGPVVMSGLNVTRRAYVPDTAGQGWACFLEYFENPTGSTITINVRLFGNVGSDGQSTITASSSGDATWTQEDRWIAADDANNGASDPSLSYNYWGAGAALTAGACNYPASQDDFYVYFGPFAVPANSTVILMYFYSQNANDANAAATAAQLDALPAEALAGLNLANFGPVLNWNIVNALNVTPHQLSVVSGQQGGPFTPDPVEYTVTNDGTVDLNWTVTGPAWVDIDPTSGTALAPEASTTVEVSANAAAEAMTPGDYVESLVFVNGADSSEVVRSIRLSVLERLTITPKTGQAASGFQGGPFENDEVTYTLKNDGADALNWTGTGPAWITVNPASGTLDPDESVTVTVSTSAGANTLTPSLYADVVTFTNTTFSTTQTRDVTIDVRERLRVTPESESVFRGVVGGPFTPAGMTYILTNISSDASVNWSIDPASIPAWMDILPATSGTLDAGNFFEINLVPNGDVNTLPAGDVTNTLVFNNESYSSTLDRDVLILVKNRIYVDAAAAPGGDGLSWATAFASVQDGIDAADANDDWVWVAAGTYPEHITMAAGVEVYGAFASGDDAMADRDFAANITTLDGQHLDTVVTFGDIQYAGVDGFYIVNGLANSDGGTNNNVGGGGIRCEGTDATNFIANCHILNNESEGYRLNDAHNSVGRGGGIYCFNANVPGAGTDAPSITGCVIAGNRCITTNNYHDFGGGICCNFASPVIRQSFICNNLGRYGGGLGCIDSSPIVEQTVISGNLAVHPGGGGGGGVFAHNHSCPVLSNCVISGNYAENWSAGAIYCQSQSNAHVTNCTIVNNRAQNVNGNFATIGGIVASVASAPVITNTLFDGMANGAIHEDDFSQNPPGASNATIVNCLFRNNTNFDLRDAETHALYTGGDNLNASVAGAVGNVAGGPDPQYIAGVAGQWSAIPVYDANTNLTTLTTAGTPFTGLDLAGSLINADTSQLRHALIMANTDNTVSVVGDVTMSAPYGYVAVNDTFKVLNFDLRGISPCINAGTDISEAGMADIAGRFRAASGIMDIGAYECQSPDGVEVVSITPVSTVTGDGTVTFEVIFSRALDNGPDAEDFAILFNALGKVIPTIREITGGDYRWYITLNTGNENGEVGLNFHDTGDAITDHNGWGTNGDFTGGTSCVVDFLRISSQPDGANKHTGEMHTFTVTAQDGIGALTYVWKKNGIDTGHRTAAYTLFDLLESDSGDYTCEVTDSYRTVTSQEAHLDVTQKVPAAGLWGLALLAGAIAGIGSRKSRR